MHDRYVEPHVLDADVITERGQDLDGAVGHIVDRVSKLIGARS